MCVKWVCMCELFNLVKWDVVENTSLQQNFPYRSRSTYTLCGCLIFKMNGNVDDCMERRWIRDVYEAGVHDVVVVTSVWHLLSYRTLSRNTFRRYDVFAYVLSIRVCIEDELTYSIRPVINVNSEYPLIWRLSCGVSSRRRSAISSRICSNRSLCYWVCLYWVAFVSRLRYVFRWSVSISNGDQVNRRSEDQTHHDRTFGGIHDSYKKMMPNLFHRYVNFFFRLRTSYNEEIADGFQNGLKCTIWEYVISKVLRLYMIDDIPRRRAMTITISSHWSQIFRICILSRKVWDDVSYESYDLERRCVGSILTWRGNSCLFMSFKLKNNCTDVDLSLFL